MRKSNTLPLPSSPHWAPNSTVMPVVAKNKNLQKLWWRAREEPANRAGGQKIFGPHNTANNHIILWIFWPHGPKIVKTAMNIYYTYLPIFVHKQEVAKITRFLSIFGPQISIIKKVVPFFLPTNAIIRQKFCAIINIWEYHTSIFKQSKFIHS